MFVRGTLLGASSSSQRPSRTHRNSQSQSAARSLCCRNQLYASVDRAGGGPWNPGPEMSRLNAETAGCWDVASALESDSPTEEQYTKIQAT